MAVWPSTVQLRRGGGVGMGVVYRLSPSGSSSLPQLDVLYRYCGLKTACEELPGWHNMAAHKQLLLDLAAWLEGTGGRAPVSFLITNMAVPLLSRLFAESLKLADGGGRFLQRQRAVISDKMERLWHVGGVLAASSLVRQGFVRQADDYRALLAKVDTAKLPTALATRHSYVSARLLHNCQEYTQALHFAREALRGTMDKEEQREMEALVNELNDSMKRAISHGDVSGPIDKHLLKEVHADLGQARTEQQDAVRQQHLSRKKSKRQTKKRVPVPKRGETSSSDSSSRRQRPHGAAPDLFSNTQNRASSSALSASTPSLPTNPSSSMSIGSSTQARNSSAIFSSRESLLCPSEWDESDYDDDYDDAAADREIRFFYSSDEHDDPQVRRMGEGEEDPQDWFEKSEQVIARGEVEEEEEETIGLSYRQASDFERGGEGRAFYPDFYRNAQELLKNNPVKYKRCQLKIERSHKAIAKVLDKGGRYTEIMIDGRSKAGRTYMDDEVVVEVLAEADLKKDQITGDTKDKMVYGQVVGLLKRANFANEEYPVLFCTLDEIEGHLMKPLCKTVPKIHVMNDTVKFRFPTLLKSRIEIKTVGVDGRIHHKRFCDVKPDQREQYVFKVVLLGWRQRNIYPLGAVMEAHIGGKDYAGGLQVLSMQQRVPKLYPRVAVEDTKRIVEESCVPKTGRLDLRGERLFTVDPLGSRDLDDAISVKTEGPDVVVGVHIADVAAVVKKDRGVDLEARRRAFTFYPLQKQPYCMLPEPLSHDQCSLLPGKPRLAFSLFFKFNQKGTQVGEPEISRTLIQSQQQLTYEEVQRVIDGHPEGMDSSIQEDILKIHAITTKLREKRQKESVLFIPFEDPRLPDLEQINQCIAAHSLIEELMILTNHHIASFLTKRPRYVDSMIVRCQKAPTWEELRQWQREEGSIPDLVMQLQGKQVTPSTLLSFNNKLDFRGQVVVQRQVWEKLCRYLEEGQVENAGRLAFMDGLHPLQSLAAGSWLDLTQTAEYVSAQDNDLRHFGLALPVYTHFTSPIRRYTDLHVQRVLHASLDDRSPDCDPDEVMKLCRHINSVNARQNAFSKGCRALMVSESLQRQPLVFRAYVDTVDEEQLTLSLPSLRSLPDRRQELPFSMVGVSCQPQLDTDTDTQSVTVQWKRRFYDEAGRYPDGLNVVWNHQERVQNKSPSSPVVITISPDQLNVSLKQQDWVKILQKVSSSGDGLGMTRVPQPLDRDRSEVKYMSSEKGDGTVSLRPVQFSRTYRRGDVVQVQLSAEPRRGMLKPRTDILHTAVNACMCTLHVSQPVLALTRHATRATRDKHFSSYKDYMMAWMPLMEMEAAVGAGEGESSVVIDNVVVAMKPQSSSELPYRGSFTLKAAFCFKRCIEFGGKSADSIREDDEQSNTGDVSFPLDYLCLRYRTDCLSTVVSRVSQSEVPYAVDDQYTWLAHASVVRVSHRGRKSEDGGELTVTFVLSPSCSSQAPPPPAQLLKKEGAKMTLELLPKSEVDRRAQELLLQLRNSELTLARTIAFGRLFPKLDADHKRLGQRDENHEVIIPMPKRLLPRNNTAQLEAIVKALTNTVAMIQGPPGSGKTNTGIKLVYLFCKINRQLEADGKGRKTVLYCGPSNKSVDLVARELKKKLGTDHCPKILRVYGSAIESKDYPVPRGDLKTIRGLRDLSCDPDLQDVALHHLIRQLDKPHAGEIARFDAFFAKCREDPDKHTVTDRDLRKYRKLLFDASVEEMQHYEVVLATCSVGGNRRMVKGISGTVFQLIIDECAMSPEPQSMVPIVATQAKQVVLIGDHKQLRPIIKCQPAAALGLDQSLFERLFQRFPENTVFLNTQYRMHPEICAFPSKEFYEGGLKTGHSMLWGGELLPFWPWHPDLGIQVPHLLVSVKGVEEMLTVNTDQGNERSKSNQLEAEKVIEIVKFLKATFKVDLLKVKLLTQYNAQRHLLEEKMKEAIDKNMDIFEHYDRFKVKVSTVVSSQGGEWDYVILSTVRSLPKYKIEQNPTHGWCRQNMGFITDRNQVNVALTRARRGLFIVGNVELLRCDDVWRHLVERYRKLGCCVDDPALFPPPPAPRVRRHRAPPRGGQHGNPPLASSRNRVY